MQSRRTLKTLEENIEEKETQSKYQLYDKGQSGEFLSYNHLTDIGLRMDKVKSINYLHHSIFYSIANEIMNWPFFLAFVTIDNDEDEV